MGQSRPINGITYEGEDTTALGRTALGWAEIAGLVEIRPNGSWSLTEKAQRYLQGRYEAEGTGSGPDGFPHLKRRRAGDGAL